MSTDLAIIILNYNTQDLLRNCLASVYANRTDFHFTVCVVDNASTDGSAAMVRCEFPHTLLVESPTNGGYASGNNLGLRAFGFPDQGPEFAMLLNPDTVVPPDALNGLVQSLRRRPRAGVIGPKLLLMNGNLDLACRRSFPTPEISFWRMIGLSRLFPRSRRFGRYNLTYLDPDRETEVDSVVGACMVLRGEVIRQVGLLDEDFFMYGEDLDWAFRIKLAGWQVLYDPAVIVYHIKKAATRQSRKAQFEFYRAMWIFYRKHYQATTPFWLHCCIMGGIVSKGGLSLLREIVTAPANPIGGKR